MKQWKPMYQKETLAKLKQMNELAPEVMKAFWAFDKAAIADGVIPVKYSAVPPPGRPLTPWPTRTATRRLS